MLLIPAQVQTPTFLLMLVATQFMCAAQSVDSSSKVQQGVILIVIQNLLATIRRLAFQSQMALTDKANFISRIILQNMTLEHLHVMLKTT